MQSPPLRLPVTLRIRGAAMGPPAARDLMGTLQATGWASTSLRQPHGGQPEVAVVIGDDTPGLRDLLGTLPVVLREWRDRNRLTEFEMVVHGQGADAMHIPVGAADGAVRDLMAGLTAPA